MLVLAIAAAATPLAPIGKWNLRYEDNNCVLVRLYGDESKPVTFGWRALPLSESIELVISESHKGSNDFRRGPVDVDLGGQTTTGKYFSYPTDKAGVYMTRVTIDDTHFSGSDEPMTVTVRPNRGHAMAFSLVNSAKAFVALQSCIADTAKLWGVDPAAEAAIATPASPLGSPRLWLTPADYPADALRVGQQGITVLLYKIETSGHVADCRAVIPSGSPTLDKAACDALTKRGRYTPALDGASKPVPSFRIRRVVWAMPGGLTGD